MQTEEVTQALEVQLEVMGLGYLSFQLEFQFKENRYLASVDQKLSPREVEELHAAVRVMSKRFKAEVHFESPAQ